MLAATYPGLPTSGPAGCWLFWPDELKQAYLDNVPYVVAERHRLEEDVTNPYLEALYRTGDKDHAEKELTKARTEAKLARLRQET